MNLQKPRKQKLWQIGELKIIKAIAGTMSLEDIAKNVNAEFNNKRTASTVKAKAHKHGIKLRMGACNA